MNSKEWSKLTKEERKKVPYKEWPKSQKSVAWIVGIALLLVFAFIIWPSSEDDNTGLPRVDQSFIVAKKIVKAQLIDPQSAEFIDENAVGSEQPNDSSFAFKGIVKATNKFGLKAPVEYRIGLKYIGGHWSEQSSYKVKFITIE